MNEKPKIKVIKKSATIAQPAGQNSVKATRVAAREMVSTVTDWVAEFKSRRSDETRAALEKLFRSQPQPNES